MSEKVLMQKKTRERLLTAGDGCAFISGLLLSALPIETSWWLLLLLFSFFYVRKRKEMILLSIACIGGTMLFYPNQLIEIVLLSGCVCAWMLVMQLLNTAMVFDADERRCGLCDE